MSHPTNDPTPGAFAAASSHEEAGSPPPPNEAVGAPKGNLKDALDHAGPTGYAPPQVRPLGTLPKATGMPTSSFPLPGNPVR